MHLYNDTNFKNKHTFGNKENINWTELRRELVERAFEVIYCEILYLIRNSGEQDW